MKKVLLRLAVLILVPALVNPIAAGVPEDARLATLPVRSPSAHFFTNQALTEPILLAARQARMTKGQGPVQFRLLKSLSGIVRWIYHLPDRLWSHSPDPDRQRVRLARTVTPDGIFGGEVSIETPFFAVTPDGKSADGGVSPEPSKAKTSPDQGNKGFRRRGLFDGIARFGRRIIEAGSPVTPAPAQAPAPSPWRWLERILARHHLTWEAVQAGQVPFAVRAPLKAAIHDSIRENPERWDLLLAYLKPQDPATLIMVPGTPLSAAGEDGMQRLMSEVVTGVKPEEWQSVLNRRLALGALFGGLKLAHNVLADPAGLIETAQKILVPESVQAAGRLIGFSTHAHISHWLVSATENILSTFGLDLTGVPFQEWTRFAAARKLPKEALETIESHRLRLLAREVYYRIADLPQVLTVLEAEYQIAKEGHGETIAAHYAGLEFEMADFTDPEVSAIETYLRQHMPYVTDQGLSKIIRLFGEPENIIRTLLRQERIKEVESILVDLAEQALEDLFGDDAGPSQDSVQANDESSGRIEGEAAPGNNSTPSGHLTSPAFQEFLKAFPPFGLPAVQLEQLPTESADQLDQIRQAAHSGFQTLHFGPPSRVLEVGPGPNVMSGAAALAGAQALIVEQNEDGRWAEIRLALGIAPEHPITEEEMVAAGNLSPRFAALLAEKRQRLGELWMQAGGSVESVEANILSADAGAAIDRFVERHGPVNTILATHVAGASDHLGIRLITDPAGRKAFFERLIRWADPDQTLVYLSFPFEDPAELWELFGEFESVLHAAQFHIDGVEPMAVPGSGGASIGVVYRLSRSSAIPKEPLSARIALAHLDEETSFPVLMAAIPVAIATFSMALKPFLWHARHWLNAVQIPDLLSLHTASVGIAGLVAVLGTAMVAASLLPPAKTAVSPIVLQTFGRWIDLTQRNNRPSQRKQKQQAVRAIELLRDHFEEWPVPQIEAQVNAISALVHPLIDFKKPDQIYLPGTIAGWMKFMAKHRGVIQPRIRPHRTILWSRIEVNPRPDMEATSFDYYSGLTTRSRFTFEDAPPAPFLEKLTSEGRDFRSRLFLAQRVTMMLDEFRRQDPEAMDRMATGSSNPSERLAELHGLLWSIAEHFLIIPPEEPAYEEAPLRMIHAIQNDVLWPSHATPAEIHALARFLQTNLIPWEALLYLGASSKMSRNPEVRQAALEGFTAALATLSGEDRKRFGEFINPNGARAAETASLSWIPAAWPAMRHVQRILGELVVPDGTNSLILPHTPESDPLDPGVKGSNLTISEVETTVAQLRQAAKSSTKVMAIGITHTDGTMIPIPLMGDPTIDVSPVYAELMTSPAETRWTVSVTNYPGGRSITITPSAAPQSGESEGGKTVLMSMFPILALSPWFLHVWNPGWAHSLALHANGVLAALVVAAGISVIAGRARLAAAA